MDVTLRQIRSFVAAGRLGNFTMAARQLHLTQPGVSRNISELEKAVGEPLFTRTGRNVALTEHGARLLERFSAVLVDLDAALLDRRHRTTRLAFPCFLPDLWSCELIPGFEERTGAQVEVSRREDVLSALAGGECDLALWCGSVDALADQVHVTVATHRRQAAVPAGSALAELDRIPWDDLATQRVVVNRFGGATRADLWSPAIPDDRVVTGAGLVECLELIAMGRGVGTAPDTFRSRVPHAGLRWVDIEGGPPVVMRLVGRAAQVTPLLEDFCRAAADLADRVSTPAG